MEKMRENEKYEYKPKNNDSKPVCYNNLERIPSITPKTVLRELESSNHFLMLGRPFTPGLLNPRQAEVFDRRHRAGEGEGILPPPRRITRERVAVARRARREAKVPEHFLRIIF